MLPGQTPYTPAELDQVHDLVDAAAASDPGEGDETIREAVKLIAAERRSWPRPTEDAPDDETLEQMSREGEMDATDGCGAIEDDGFCEHGHPSWMLWLGMI